MHTQEDRLEDPVRSRDIPERLEKFRLAHKNVFKADDGEEPAEITGPEYAKRMKGTNAFALLLPSILASLDVYLCFHCVSWANAVRS